MSRVRSRIEQYLGYVRVAPVIAVVLITAIACSGTSGPTGVSGDMALVSPSALDAKVPVPGGDPKDVCKNGGWQKLVKEDGSGFKNQSDCVSYVAHGGVPRDPSVVGNCTPSVAIIGPPVDSDNVTRVFRKAPFDFTANVQLDGPSCGSWSTAWTYAFGGDPAVPVPSSWIVGGTLHVPRWTLEKYTATGKRYTFTLTATPPSGSGLSPLTAARTVHVLGTRPTAGFGPTGFSAPLVPDVYTYRALGVAPHSVDPDNPEASPRLRYFWYAEVFGADEITPESGQGTPTVQYRWSSLETFLIRLTVCPSDEPTPPTDDPTPQPPGAQPWPYGFTGCGFTNDFIFSTTAN